MNWNLDRREIYSLSMIWVLGFLVSLFFCFVIYPQIRNSYHVLLDPDGYGILGINLWRGYGFSFNPEDGPTIYRGPLYPGFIALVLKLSQGWYPGGIWVAHSLLYGFNSVILYLIAKSAWNRSTASLVGFSSPIYPVLFWYTPRIWNENLLMFLVTSMIYISIIFIKKTTIPKAVGLGILLGLLCLTKAVFLPLLFVLPLCFSTLVGRRKITSILLMTFVAISIIAPWTVRNYLLLGRIVPVHTGMGVNFKVGNALAKDFLSDPLSYDALWERNIGPIISLTGDLVSRRPLRDIEQDDIYTASALADIEPQSSLLLRKVLVAGSMFWYIGENRPNTLVLLALRLPILILALFGICRTLRRRETALWPAIVVILIYWISHLPFAPLSRLSVPIMPLIFAFAVSNWSWFSSKVLSEE